MSKTIKTRNTNLRKYVPAWMDKKLRDAYKNGSSPEELAAYVDAPLESIKRLLKI